jgi:hypothetical protein
VHQEGPAVAVTNQPIAVILSQGSKPSRKVGGVKKHHFGLGARAAAAHHAGAQLLLLRLLPGQEA